MQNDKLVNRRQMIVIICLFLVSPNREYDLARWVRGHGPPRPKSASGWTMDTDVVMPSPDLVELQKSMYSADVEHSWLSVCLALRDWAVCKIRCQFT